MTKPAKRAIGGKPNRRAAGQPPDVAPMVGDGMAGSPRAIIRETRQCWLGASGKQSARLAGGSQSVRSSEEAGNDRGAKGCRKVAVWRSERRKKRTNASARKGWPVVEFARSNWLGENRTSDRRTGGRGEAPLPLDRAPTDWRAGCGRSARPVRREGAAIRSSYPYQAAGAKGDGLREREASRTALARHRFFPKTWFLNLFQKTNRDVIYGNAPRWRPARRRSCGPSSTARPGT